MSRTKPAALGSQLRSLRISAGLSQAELALRVGLSDAQISRIENGHRSTSADSLRRWYEACGYALEAIHLGPEHDASAIVTALVHLAKDEHKAVLTIVEAWPHLSERTRGMILGLVYRDEK